MNLIQVKDAAFSYDSKINVFHNISIAVEKGEAFLVVGPNGCGKSTLIDNLLGLKKLQAGSIEISGKDIHRMKPKEIAEHLAYVPQGHEKSFAIK
jgi:iron complex transport system ATP-binding protein